MDKTLKDKAIDIKGRKYVLVSDRVLYFNDAYKNGSIVTEIIGDAFGQMVVVKATVTPDVDKPSRMFTGYSQAVWGEGMVNKTAALENSECVPIDARILTRDGWKYYFQLKAGKDFALSLNNKGNISWEIVDKISIYKDQPVISARTSRFNCVFTPNHKWFVEKSLVPFNEIKKYQKIDVVGNKRDLTEYDKDSAKLGWIFTDSHIKRTKDGLPSSTTLTQSKTKYIPDIIKLFGQPNKIKKTRWKDSHCWNISPDETRKILGKFGVNTANDLPKAVCGMSISEAAGFFVSCMMADGDGRSISKSTIAILEALQIAASMLGIKTGKIIKRKPQNKTKTDLFVLPIHKTSGAYKSEMIIRKLPPVDVWCPTLKTGNWLMQYKNQVYFTGNTSAVGRALALMGIGVIESIASADEINKANNTDEAEGVCATCGSVMRRSKAGNLYCPSLYKKYAGNPHFSQSQPSPEEQSFMNSLN